MIAQAGDLLFYFKALFNIFRLNVQFQLCVEINSKSFRLTVIGRVSDGDFGA